MKNSTLTTIIKITTILLLFCLLGFLGYSYKQYLSFETFNNRLKIENQLLETRLKKSRIEFEIAIKKNISLKDKLVFEKQKTVDFLNENKNGKTNKIIK
jgi:hypothetical protein